MFLTYSAWIAASVLLAGALAAQEPTSPANKQPGRQPTLKIVPLDGDGAVNDLLHHTASRVVVEVRDRNERPIPGADVTFELPETGPGGSFPADTKVQKVVTNSHGQATTTGLTPNETTGRFLIQVAAMANGVTARGSVTQINSTAPPKKSAMAAKSSKKWTWVALAALGGGAAAGLGLALGSSGHSGSVAAANPSIVISPGTVTVGGPR